MALEVPPGDAVLGADDGRSRAQQRADRGCERGQAVRLQAENDHVGIGDRRDVRRWRPGGLEVAAAGCAPARRARPSPRRCSPRAISVTSLPARASAGAHVTRRSRPHRATANLTARAPSSCAAIRDRCTFPVGVRGICSTMWIRSGTLNAASAAAGRRGGCPRWSRRRAGRPPRATVCAVLLVGDRRTRPPRPPRVGEQHVLDLVGRDVLAAADDQLLEPAPQAQVAVRRARPRSPVRNQPSKNASAFASVVVQVARRDAGAADRDLAGRTGRHVAPAASTIRISAPGRHADRAGLARGRGQRVGGHLVAGLGHAVGLEHRHPERSSAARRAAAARARSCTSGRSAASGPGSPGAVLEDHLVHGRPGREPGHAVGGEPGPRTAAGAKRRGTTTVPPAAELRQRRGDEPVDVEERHRAVRDVGRVRARRSAAIERAEAVRLRCRSGTCLGRLVVPLVCRSSATSSGPP